MTLSDATNDFPVRLGSMLFTLIEPHEGHERDYNRWYERDHFYAGCLVGEWNFAGGRFVATAALKRERLPAAPPLTGGDGSRGSFLSLYWIHDGHHDDWAAWGGRTVKQLHADDRMFPHRDHVHTKLYAFDWALGRDPDPVPVELALDHPFRGLAVLAGTATRPADEVDAWFRDTALPSALPGSGAALVARFSLLPMPSDAPGVPSETADEGHFLHLYFLDGDPAEAYGGLLPGLVSELEAEGLAEVELAAPFHATVPGTDRYVDEIR